MSSFSNDNEWVDFQNDTQWLRHNEGVAITPQRVKDADIHAEPLFEDRFVLAMRKGHPLARKRVTLRRFCELDHVLVSLRGGSGGPVDVRLAQAGRSRRVARVVPSHLLAAQIVASSNRVSTFPARLVEAVGAQYGLVARTLPLDLPAFEFRVSWHRRHDASPIHRFMRELLKEAAVH